MAAGGALTHVSVPGPGFNVDADLVAGAYVCAAVAAPVGDLSPGQVR
jgi:hypothetical protein